MAHRCINLVDWQALPYGQQVSGSIWDLGLSMWDEGLSIWDSELASGPLWDHKCWD